MKFVGFIKEHNNIIEAKEYNSILGNVKNSEEIIVSINNYLNNGVVILAWMNYIKDLDNNDLIAPNCYYTDGNYIWPAYFSYYLKKYPNYKIDTEFLEHLTEVNFNFNRTKITAEFKKELEKQLLENLKY